jgi:hypothetical protein
VSSEFHADYESYSRRSVRAAKGPTPAPSNHPSRTTPDEELDMNIDIITRAPQDHRTAKRQVCRFYSNRGSLWLKSQLAQALKRDGSRCMLSGKFDLAFHTNLEKKYNQADYEHRRISRAADAASDAPDGSEWKLRAADLAKEADNRRKAADRYATALARFPTNPQLSPTNASHIFPESINANLDVENKVSNGSIC